MWFGIGFVRIVECLVFLEWREFDRDSIGGGLLEVVAVETREHDGDVVLTTAIVSFFNQLIARPGEVAFGVDNDLLNIVCT